ncbi:putative membrane protein [Chlamydia psittaci 06-1683]|nr:putative membrane protein [Chlamydia psittaci 06-1683]
MCGARKKFSDNSRIFYQFSRECMVLLDFLCKENARSFNQKSRSFLD